MTAMGSRSSAMGPDAKGQILIAEEGRVALFGPTQSEAVPEDALDCAGLVIEPGRVNAHTHLYSGLAPLGMPPPMETPQSFLEILERVWWRLDRALDEQALRASARYYIADALLHGTTTLIDHHESPNCVDGSLEILADVCQGMGIRAVLCYGATERNSGREEGENGLSECRRFVESNKRPLVRGAIGLHASFTVSDDTIREAGDLCRELRSVLHTHLAEDRVDVTDAWSRGYEGPLERLMQLSALPPGSILAHGVYLERAQVHKVAKGKSWIVQNPRSNRGNGVGYPKALGGSWRVALGTDGYPSDMTEEDKALKEEAGKAGEPLPDVAQRLDAGHDLIGELYRMDFSPLAKGCAADAVAVGTDGVRHVMIDGRIVVRDGRLLTADVDDIRGGAEDQAMELWKRMALA